MLEDSWRHSLVGKASAIRNYAGTIQQQLRASLGTMVSLQEIALIAKDIDTLAAEIANAPVRVPQSWEMQPEQLPLANLVEEVVRRTCRPAALGPGVALALRLDLEALEGVLVNGHRRWLIYAFECLLHNALNALRTMPGGGAIMVSGQRAGDYAEVRIKDSGPGVPQDIRPYLFVKSRS